MSHKVLIKKKVEKSLYKLPALVQKKFVALVEDLKETGPIQPKWPNYSKLGKNKYHCHLGYSWSACWQNEDGKLVIEIYYVGSREDAPY